MKAFRERQYQRDAPPPEATARWMLPTDKSENDFTLNRDTLWFRMFLYGSFVIACSYCIFVLPAKIPNNQVAILHFKGYFALASVHFMIFWTLSYLRNHVPPARGRRLALSKSPADHALECKLRILQDSVLTGADDGYIWLTDEVFHYRGLQTAFRLSRQDIPPMMLWRRCDISKADALNDPLIIPLTEEVNACTIKLTIVEPLLDYSRRSQVAKFREKFCQWVASAPQVESAQSVFPPLSLHPCYLSAGGWKKEAIIVGWSMIGLCFLTMLLLLMADNQNSVQLSYRWLAATVLFASATSSYCAIRLATKGNRIRDYLESTYTNFTSH